MRNWLQSRLGYSDRYSLVSMIICCYFTYDSMHHHVYCPPKKWVESQQIKQSVICPLTVITHLNTSIALFFQMELLQDPAHNFNMVPQQTTDLSTPSNLHSSSSSPNAWQLTAMLQQQQQQLQLRQAPPSLPAQLQLQHQIFSQSLQLQQQQQQQQFRQQLPQVQLEEQYNNPQASLVGQHGMVPSRNRVNTRAQTTATTHNMNLGGGPPSTSTGGSYNPGRAL